MNNFQVQLKDENTNHMITDIIPSHSIIVAENIARQRYPNATFWNIIKL